MRRRRFLTGAGNTVAAGLLGGLPGSHAFAEVSDGPPLAFAIEHGKRGNALPADFTGLGFEISSVARPGLLSPHNGLYVQLVRTLGRSGVVRIGGNTSDFSRLSMSGPPVSSPRGTIVTPAVLQDLGDFLEATGSQLIWGLNLGGGTAKEDVQNALDQAELIARVAGPRLLAIEIGNEPDLFSIEHRPKPYHYEDFRREFEPVRDALLTRLPKVPLAGPDVAGAEDWVEQFARDESRNLRLLTRHYYREGQNATSTAAKLLAVDPQLAPMLDRMAQVSRSSGLPFRLCEVNSFSGGGRPGVSDTFAQALWVLDYMLRIAEGGASGVNIETGVNQLGFISSYSPIADDEQEHYTPAPGFYGMLAFAEARGATGTSYLLRSWLETGGRNIVGYAVEQTAGDILAVLIHREPSNAAVVRIGCGFHKHATVLRLTAPSLAAKSGVLLGGRGVAKMGSWRAPAGDAVPIHNGFCEVDLPPGSAALVRLQH